jgi:hypothetical protein
MNPEETKVESVDIAVKLADPAQSKATSAETRIHWASTTEQVRPELEQQFEAMRARNWMTEKMVQQYQKHWHCSREVALERLLAKSGA